MLNISIHKQRFHRKDAEGAKLFICPLETLGLLSYCCRGGFAYGDVGEEREQDAEAMPANYWLMNTPFAGIPNGHESPLQQQIHFENP